MRSSARTSSTRFVAAALLSLATGCIAPASKTCADGHLCPASKVCAPGGGCASPDQLQACAGSMEGANCTVSAGTGRCRGGVCALGAGCGDHIVDVGEACDDGNTTSGDGCRGDCLKIESCGDGVVDVGEACDDGNQNPADGCDACRSTVWAAKALVGQKPGGATPTPLASTYGVALDRQGNVYFSESDNATGARHRVLKLDPKAGVFSTVAGSGLIGFSGDGGAAGGAQLNEPRGITVDGLGDLYIADYGNNRVRKVDAATGVISTVAGNGAAGYLASDDGGAATSAWLNQPSGVAIDGLGNLYIADSANHRIRRVTRGTITTIAGSGADCVPTCPGGFGGDGGPATSAQLNLPMDVALDGFGDLYIADLFNSVIRKVKIATGVISTVAGTPLSSNISSGDDGPATSALLNSPKGVALDGLGDVYIAEAGGNCIRKVSLSTGVISRVANEVGAFGYAGDGGAATSALLNSPAGMAVDGLGNVYLADSLNDVVRKVDGTSGIISTLAGVGPVGFVGNATPATALVLAPAGVALDTLGNNLYLSDFACSVFKVDVHSGTIARVAGNDSCLFGTFIDAPRGLAVDSNDNVYFADVIYDVIRRLDAATGLVSTVAGQESVPGFSGDGGGATNALLDTPSGVAVDGLGNLYIADRGNHRVRKVSAQTGLITTFAGKGTPGFSGDGAGAPNAQLDTPSAVALDALGNVYIADQHNHRVRKVSIATGFISTVAGTGTAGYRPMDDGGAATAAELDTPHGVALDGLGNVYIADTNNQRIRRVDALTGRISTVVGSGTFGAGSGGFLNDAGAANNAWLLGPTGVTLDKLGNLYIVDAGNFVVRRVDALTGRIFTVAGSVEPEGMGPVAQAHLADPSALAWGPMFSFVAGGSTGTVQVFRGAAGEVEVAAGRYPQNSATSTLARFRAYDFGSVGGVAYDALAGRLYLTEQSSTGVNCVHVVTIVDPADQDTWTIAPLAGDASQGFGPGFGDGPALSAAFHRPTGLYLDLAPPAPILYVADTGNHAVRAIDLKAGAVSTVAGTPTMFGDLGDGQPATLAQLNSPEAVTRCGDDLFIADTGNHRVRRLHSVDPTNPTVPVLISTVLGVGVAASAGQGVPASSFPVDNPRGLACDALGNLYVSSRTTVRLLPAGVGGVVDGTGAVQTIFGGPPRDAFPASASACLTGLAVVDDKTIQLTDSCTGLLIELVRQIAP